jgi:hypothetical protein
VQVCSYLFVLYFRGLFPLNDWCNYIQAFVITFSFGMGAIPWLMISEVHYLVAYT